MEAANKRLLEDLAAIISGVFFLTLGFYPDMLISLLAMLAGSLVICYACFDLALTLRSLDRQLLVKFKDDKRGLAWIWIAGFGLAIPFCALTYWVLDYPFDIIVDTVTPIYTFTGTMASAWSLTQLFISYLLTFAIIYVVLWVIVNSKNPSPWGG